MSRRFKLASMQRLYDTFRISPPKDRLNGLHNAYHVGFDNPERHRYERTSLAYAVWAAGVDNALERPHDL